MENRDAEIIERITGLKAKAAVDKMLEDA